MEFNACFYSKGCKLFKSETILGDGSNNFWFDAPCEKSINYPQSYFCSEGLILKAETNEILFLKPKTPDDTVPS